MSAELVRLFLVLTLLGQRPRLQLFEVSAYSRLCTPRSAPWFGVTASGKPASVGMCALPVEFEFGTRVWLDAGEDGGSGWGEGTREVRCEDRGRAIRSLVAGKVARLDLCFVGLSSAGDHGDERAAVLWGRRMRWGIVGGATQAAAAQAALVRVLVAGGKVEPVDRVTLLWPPAVGTNPRLTAPAYRPRKRLPDGSLQATYTERELAWALRLLDGEAGHGGFENGKGLSAGDGAERDPVGPDRDPDRVRGDVDTLGPEGRGEAVR